MYLILSRANIYVAKRDNVGERAGRKRAALQRQQRMLWNLLLAVGLVIFFVLSVWWIGIDLRMLPVPSQQTQDLMDAAELAAIAVFAIELYGRFRKSANAGEFLRKNWLGILVLLPIGILVRFARGLEAAGLLRPAEVASKLGEDVKLAPALASAGKAAAHAGAEAQKWASHFSGISDFLAMVSETVGKLLR
jgi:hypothetical protein